MVAATGISIELCGEGLVIELGPADSEAAVKVTIRG